MAQAGAVLLEYYLACTTASPAQIWSPSTELLGRPITVGMLISIAVLLAILVLVFIGVVRRSR
jgi:hypothetical protein